ncbi:hypothetical protein I4U23_000767 [Adineta vaga]|nr:hypothetical protein I4U23_000767 [Adineta vaga]
MGCKQVKVNPGEPVNEVELERIVSTTSEANIISNTTKRHSVLAYLNPLAVSRSAADETINLNPSTPATPVTSQSNNDNNITTITTKFNETSSTFIVPEETVVYRQNISTHVTVHENLSDTHEYSSMSIRSHETDNSYSTHGSFLSSSNNSNMLAFGEDAIRRFISARPNRPVNQASTHRGNWSEQDDISYSLRDSMASTVSADSEGSVVDLPRVSKPVFVHPKNQTSKQKTLVNQTSSDFDGSELHPVTDTNSATIDLHVMTERVVSNLRSESTKLSNYDYQSRGVISETSNESDGT